MAYPEMLRTQARFAVKHKHPRKQPEGEELSPQAFRELALSPP